MVVTIAILAVFVSLGTRKVNETVYDRTIEEKWEMNRALLIWAMLAALSPRCAEAAERVWRLGVLTLADDSAVRSVMLPYLAPRGFVEGRNLVVDLRVGTEEQMPALAQALVGDKAD